MIRYIGLDVHKDVVQACLIDEQGRRLESHRLPCTKESLEAFARERLCATDHVALEATTNTWAVVALLRPHVARIVVGNPLRTRAIAEAKVKTDKVDAEVLAQLLRCDYLPAVWQPDEDTRAAAGAVLAPCWPGRRPDAAQEPRAQPAGPAADRAAAAHALRGGG